MARAWRARQWGRGAVLNCCSGEDKKGTGKNSGLVKHVYRTICHTSHDQDTVYVKYLQHRDMKMVDPRLWAAMQSRDDGFMMSGPCGFVSMRPGID